MVRIRRDVVAADPAVPAPEQLVAQDRCSSRSPGGWISLMPFLRLDHDGQGCPPARTSCRGACPSTVTSARMSGRAPGTGCRSIHRHAGITIGPVGECVRVRSARRPTASACAGFDDRAAAAQRVRRGAGRCGDDQAIAGGAYSRSGRPRVADDVQHAAFVSRTLQHDIVEGIGRDNVVSPSAFVQSCARSATCAGVALCSRPPMMWSTLASISSGRDIREEPQAPPVNRRAAGRACSSRARPPAKQHRTVTADSDDEVGVPAHEGMFGNPPGLDARGRPAGRHWPTTSGAAHLSSDSTSTCHGFRDPRVFVCRPRISATRWEMQCSQARQVFVRMNRRRSRRKPGLLQTLDRPPSH